MKRARRKPRFLLLLFSSPAASCAGAKYVKIAGSPFDNSGTREFTPPPANSSGDGNFVPILKTWGE